MATTPFQDGPARVQVLVVRIERGVRAAKADGEPVRPSEPGRRTGAGQEELEGFSEGHQGLAACQSQ